MTKREQLLLAGVVLLGVCILPYTFLFRGMTQEKQALEDKLLQQQEVQLQIAQTQTNMEQNRQNFALRWEELNAARSQFSFLTTTYDAHNIFTSLAAQYNMSIMRLDIKNLEPIKLDNQPAAETAPTPPAGEAGTVGDGTSLPAYTYTPVEYDPLYPCRMQVNLTVTGTLENSLGMADAIATEGDSYRVQSVTYSTLQPDDNGNVNLMLSAVIYVAATAAEGGFTP